MITPEKNLWHCLGACQAGGSVIDWVMRAEGVSFRHAVELLAGGACLRAAGASRAPAREVDGDEAARRRSTREADDEELLRAGGRLLPRDVEGEPGGARVPRESAGSEHAEMIERFRLGFANRTLGYRLPEKNRKAGAEIRGRLHEARHPARERARALQRVARDPDLRRRTGRVRRDVRAQDHAEAAARDAAAPVPAGAAPRRLQRGGARGEPKEVILCEALIDALTFWCAGYRNVTAATASRASRRSTWRRFGEPRHRAGADRVRPRRGGRSRGGEAERAARPRRGSRPTACSFRRDGRERVRAEGGAGGEEPRSWCCGKAEWMGKGSGVGSRAGGDAEDAIEPETIAKSATSRRRRESRGRLPSARSQRRVGARAVLL